MKLEIDLPIYKYGEFVGNVQGAITLPPELLAALGVKQEPADQGNYGGPPVGLVERRKELSAAMGEHFAIWNPENAPTDNLPEGWEFPKEMPKKGDEVLTWMTKAWDVNPRILMTKSCGHVSYLIRSTPPSPASGGMTEESLKRLEDKLAAGSDLGHVLHPTQVMRLITAARSSRSLRSELERIYQLVGQIYSTGNPPQDAVINELHQIAIKGRAGL